MQGPLLVTPNHLSFLDPPLTAVALRRALRFMAKDSLFKVPGFGWLIRSVGAFPVHKGSADTEAIRKAIELLKAGHAVLVFPEGTRGDGSRLGPISPGIAILAKRSGAPVLPVRLIGTERSLPRGAKWPKRTRFRVLVGTPFSYADIAPGESEAARREAFVATLGNAIAQLGETERETVKTGG
jgi:1-acyl-sn-glycerol-3-phosphate acyltransferase